MSDTWCPLPWIHQDINNNGEIRVCCPASASESRGFLKKEDGSVYNAAGDDLESARNSPTLRKIRSEMLQGKPPSACIRCRREEASGILSRRQQRTEYYKNIITLEKARKLTGGDGTVNPSEVPLVDYDLRLGNRCNLKCRMCAPSSSDSWYSDFVKVFGAVAFYDHDTKIHLIKNKSNVWQTKGACYNWFESPVFRKSIKKLIPHIRHIHIVGGEPLIISAHYELLELIVQHGSPKDTVIEYNTNLTLLPKKAVKYWEHFKKIQIAVSIDGYGAVNNYIRYPSLFEKIEKNLHKLDTLFDNTYVWISTTVNAYNIFHLPELIAWKLKQRFSKVNNEKSANNPLITPHLLHTPPILSVKILPADYKMKVRQKFNRFLDDFPNLLRDLEIPPERHERLSLSLKKLLKGYSAYMDSEDLSYHIPAFVKYTEGLDKIRNEKCQNVLPELWESLRPYRLNTDRAVPV